MKVILREDVAGVGAAGQTVDVKNGYGRNFLLPRNLAIPATKANLKSIDVVRQQQDVRLRKARRAAETVKDRLEKISVSAEVLVGEEDKVFGSVTNADIAELLAKEGVTVDKKTILLEQPIKALGVYTVPIKVARDVVAEIKVWVVKKS
jgi:large subunit ribosomal protein L9